MNPVTCVDELYTDLIHHVLRNGVAVKTRNADTLKVFGLSMFFTRTPLVQIRRTAWVLALREWEWFMSGSDNVNDLHESVRHWWQPYADAQGRVRYNYGSQFHKFHGRFGTVDQIQALVSGIKEHPYSRRHVITTWNTADMLMADCPITNCHGTVIQANVNPDNTLDLMMHQRSVDVIVGLPHNLIQYWAFLNWLAYWTGHSVGKFVWTGGDVHIYDKHQPVVAKMLYADALLNYENQPRINLVYEPTVANTFLARDFSLDGTYKPLIDEKAEMIA